MTGLPIVSFLLFIVAVAMTMVGKGEDVTEVENRLMRNIHVETLQI